MGDDNTILMGISQLNLESIEGLEEFKSLINAIKDKLMTGDSITYYIKVLDNKKIGLVVKKPTTGFSTMIFEHFDGKFILSKVNPDDNINIEDYKEDDFFIMNDNSVTDLNKYIQQQKILKF